MKVCAVSFFLAGSSLLLLQTRALHTQLPKRSHEKTTEGHNRQTTEESQYGFTQKPFTSPPDPEPVTPSSQCVQCCDPRPAAPMYQLVPQVNLTILKGEKGDSGSRGLPGKSGKAGSPGPRGPVGARGLKGSTGTPGDPCKNYYSAFSVGRKKSLHSNDYYQPLIFDTELVNLYGHFNMFTGKFFCYIPGIYFFNLNVHTWNQKETYMHVMKNEQEMVILYAQPSDRSIMQSQSLMLELQEQDEVWVRLFKGERENAVFSDDFDTYVTFNGYLIKPASET
ncbi:complement C1q tumor necrosis factor-related protein 1 [Bombina bombina]|uniref:complement C1q tumor necrosis factor-related protein 1 n=1 Tax=Bombina bombina TaxID=8345 RepID=UPI00235A6043|nr:complement C1q tumor necrosis factor-related protein 1 [Bombina bombina]XP_053562332.1 complement C1q tumor necrosis factor-related protein 1 [Bombina bombina]